jgi:hypothetical protein
MIPREARLSIGGVGLVMLDRAYHFASRAESVNMV